MATLGNMFPVNEPLDYKSWPNHMTFSLGVFRIMGCEFYIMLHFAIFLSLTDFRRSHQQAAAADLRCEHVVHLQAINS
jgi:hypothetical protein